MDIVATIPGGRDNVLQYAHPALWQKWEQSALQAYWGPGGDGEARAQSGDHAAVKHPHTRARQNGQGGLGLTPESSVVTASQAPDQMAGSVAPSRMSSYPSTAATSRPLRAIPEHEQEVEQGGRRPGASQFSALKGCRGYHLKQVVFSAICTTERSPQHQSVSLQRPKQGSSPALPHLILTQFLTPERESLAHEGQVAS